MAERDLVAPPQRYRVVERGGQLVVIDGGEQTPGARLSSASPQTAPGRAGKSFVKTAFDGRGILTTKAFYDLKGPRRLAVGSDIGALARWVPIAGVFAVLGVGALALFAPWVLVVIPIMAQPKLWQRWRMAITAWLDRFPAAT